MAFRKENPQVPEELSNLEVHQGSTLCVTRAAGFIGSWLIMPLFETENFNGNDLGLHKR